jgi:hypothetical protein
MWKIFKCRRSSLALLAMALLTGMGCYLKVDTSGAIAMIAMGVAASNASQAVGESFAAKKHTPVVPQD